MTIIRFLSSRKKTKKNDARYSTRTKIYTKKRRSAKWRCAKKVECITFFFRIIAAQDKGKYTVRSKSSMGLSIYVNILTHCIHSNFCLKNGVPNGASHDAN